MKAFLVSIIRNAVLVNVLMVVIIALGVIGSQVMVREVFPEISVDMLMVSVAYPGADPADVEEGISRKIEEAIDGIEGIKRYTTVSSESFARVPIEVVEGFPMDHVYTDVRNAIDSISTFPVDAEKPIISEATIRNEVILLTLWGEQPEQVLKEFSESIKDELQALEGVSQVSISGTRDYEIGIELSEDRLREYGLSFGDVAQAVRRGSLNLSGGELRTEGEQIRLRTVGRKYRGEDFASIVVMAQPNGEIITLADIATVKDGFVEDEVYTSFNGEPAVTIGVYKTSSEDAIQIAKNVKAYAAQRMKELPAGLHMTVWSDRSELIEQRIDLLVRNGIQGLLIVFLLLWVFLDLRLAFWVTMGIPISLAGGLVIMWLCGATLNELSLFGLIMVLGIVVDDAIIVGEAIYVHRRRGDPPLTAAVNGVSEVALPVTAAIITTLIAFIPLWFVHGVMGKFIAIIPLAVISTISVSLFESLFMLPSHLSHLPPMANDPSKEQKRNRRFRAHFNQGFDWFVQHVYGRFMRTSLNYRYITASCAILVVLVTMGLVSGGFVKFVLFPDGDQRDLEASVEFPTGTPPSVTASAVAQIQEAFVRVTDQYKSEDGGSIVSNFSSAVGQSGGDDFDRSAGNNLGAVRAELIDGKQRDIGAIELARLWEEETGTIPGVLSMTFGTMEMGPPGAPIQVSLNGNDIDTLRTVSEEIKAKLRTYDGVFQISDSFRPGKNELRIDLKPEARTLGIQLDDLARQVYAGYFGEEAVRLQRGRDDIRVRVRYSLDQRSTLAELEQVRIRTPQGHEVPFFSVADVTFGQGDAAISRVDGTRSIIVMADNDPARANAQEIISDLSSGLLPGLRDKYPGWNFEFWGAQQQSAEAFTGLLISFPMALLAMYIVIAATFRSYLQPMVIMIIVPFGSIGAVWGHLLLGRDLTMFSVFGIVALAGIVINDAIVLIDAVNTNISQGMPVMEAIRQAGMRRFRAILLTSLTTIGGLSTLIFATGMGSEVVSPMALSLGAGVACSTVLTLVLVPSLMVILNDLRCLVYWLIRAKWPTREQVEPAWISVRDKQADGYSSGAGTAGEPIAAK